MSEMMQALIVDEPGKFALRSTPRPTISSYEALVRIEACGICNSTDWKMIRGQFDWMPPFPIILGHESVGVVEAVGEKVAKFRVGDRVTRPTYPSGQHGLNSGIGGFAEYGIVYDAQAMADHGDAGMLDDYNALRQNIVPPELNPAEASLAISLSETASVLNGLPNLRGKTIVITGTGIAGLSLGLWCKLAGANVVTLGRRQPRLDKARELGADHGVTTLEADWLAQVEAAAGGKVDGVLEAVGDPELAGQVEGLIHEDGFLVAYGAPPSDQAYSSRWTVADVTEHTCYPWVADLMRRGWVRADWFISHNWPMPQLPEALAEVKAGKVVKGIVSLD